MDASAARAAPVAGSPQEATACGLHEVYCGGTSALAGATGTAPSAAVNVHAIQAHARDKRRQGGRGERGTGDEQDRTGQGSGRRGAPGPELVFVYAMG